MSRAPALLLAVIIATVALVVPSAIAPDFCDGHGDAVTLLGRAYVTIDAGPFEGEYPVGMAWIYVESNGELGLQRGGATLLGVDDVCQDSPNPDTAIATFP